MNRPVLLRFNWSALINWLTDDIQNAPQSLTANRHTNRCPCILHWLASNKAICTIHGNGTDGPVTKMLCDLKHQALSTPLHLERRLDGWELTIGKVNIDNSADNLHKFQTVIIKR